VRELAVSEVRTNRADFEALIGPYLEAGYRTALAILRDPNEAHDAVQESALKAWRKLNQLREGRPARPWFLAIVANQCRDMRRSRWWSVVRLPHIDTAKTETDTETTDLGRALARLPYEDRLALFLYFYLDLSFEDVGAVLRLSPAGAKTRVYRAAKKLRPGLEMD
jgi:RNA polymerase sigma-70 factor (ECF subfamily)